MANPLRGIELPEQNPEDSGACCPVRWGRAIVASACANPRFELNRVARALLWIRSGIPRAVAAERKRILAHEQHQRITSCKVPARRQDTTLRSGLQSPRRNHQPLNFAGALVNFRDSRVPVSPFDGVFPAVAVAAVNLNGFVRYPRGHFAGK